MVRSDQRPLVQRPEPANKLSETERAAVLEVFNSKEFFDLPPSQIVPKLADEGRYLASMTQRGIKLLPHLARRRATASSGPRQTAHQTQTTDQLSGNCTMPSLDLGYHVDAWASRGYVLLSLPDRGYLQPQDCRLGGP